ncbi:hypothetical protein B0O99DRAFT_691022 [Bisporella sp. PMI_857]|nr:hypothetical protein B0O99DRAFT_691022 [Bisporella sp. PMI_857]
MPNSKLKAAVQEKAPITKKAVPGNPEPKPEPPWSDWVWDAEQQFYYRGKLEPESKIWRYEYAAGPAPLGLAVVEQFEAPRILNMIVPIQYTKEDMELKFVYAPEPSYFYGDMYPTEASPKATSATTAPSTGGTEKKAVKEEAKPEPPITSEKKKEEKPKKDPTRAPSLEKQKMRRQKWERIVAYLESVEREEKHRRKEQQLSKRYMEPHQLSLRQGIK